MSKSRLLSKTSNISRKSPSIFRQAYMFLFEDDIAIAALKNEWNLVIDYVKLGIDPNDFKNSKYSVLHSAVIDARNDIVAFLLEHNADPNLVDKSDSVTSLHSAIYHGNSTAGKLFLINGADYTVTKDKSGYTAIDIAKRFPKYKMHIFNDFFSARDQMASAAKEGNISHNTGNYLEAFKAFILAGDSLMRLVGADEHESITQHYIKKAQPHYMNAIESYKLLSDAEKSTCQSIVQKVLSKLERIGIDIPLFNSENEDEDIASSSPSSQREHACLLNRKSGEKQAFLSSTTRGFRTTGFFTSDEEAVKPAEGYSNTSKKFQ